MNMKNLLIIALALGIVFSACSKKEESPNPTSKTTTTTTGGGGGGGGGGQQPALTTASTPQFWGKIDGVVTSYVEGAIYQSGYQRDSTVGIDSVTDTYQAGLVKADLSNIFAFRGKMVYPKLTIPSESVFLSLFAPGSYAYSEGFTEIYFSLGLFNDFSTAGGDQTGSSFEIVQMTPTGSSANPKCKVVIKFNCKVYNTFTPSLTKTITEGIMVLEFGVY